MDGLIRISRRLGYCALIIGVIVGLTVFIPLAQSEKGVTLGVMLPWLGLAGGGLALVVLTWIFGHYFSD